MRKQREESGSAIILALGLIGIMAALLWQISAHSQMQLARAGHLSRRQEALLLLQHWQKSTAPWPTAPIACGAYLCRLKAEDEQGKASLRAAPSFWLDMIFKHRLPANIAAECSAKLKAPPRPNLLPACGLTEAQQEKLWQWISPLHQAPWLDPEIAPPALLQSLMQEEAEGNFKIEQPMQKLSAQDWGRSERLLYRLYVHWQDGGAEKSTSLYVRRATAPAAAPETAPETGQK